jgi:hypothetical protein
LYNTGDSLADIFDPKISDMKKILTIGLILFIQCSFAQVSSDLKKLSWLEGTWERTNTKPGKKGFETWTKVSDTEWKGKGVNLTGADTTFIEKLKLIVKEGVPYYVADVPENQKEVLFKFTALTRNGFVCENPQHDFPKKISYQRDGDKLKAVISGDGKSIEYLFIKR